MMGTIGASSYVSALKGNAAPLPRKRELNSGGNSSAPSFSETLRDALVSVNDSQLQADQKVRQLAGGDGETLLEAMVAMEKAEMAMSFTIEVRNKLVEAYQDLMRMQI